jgi:Holliday junction resolvase RusA-like endonuclease
MIAFTILGEPASKANSRRLVYVRGRKRIRALFIRSKKALKYVEDAKRQIPGWAKRNWQFPVKVTIRIFYATERPDLDESLILDVLQSRYKGNGKNRVLVEKGVYANDRLVREKHIYHGIDRARPRAEIVVEPLFPEATRR